MCRLRVVRIPPWFRPTEERWWSTSSIAMRFLFSSSSISSSSSSSSFSSLHSAPSSSSLLELEEVEKVLREVKADDVRVVPVSERCDWADFMVIASGRSSWHVKNIAQALIYKVKQKQKGAEQMVLPSVEGHESGKWVVVDSGGVIIHALDEKARSYYNLESLWTTEMQPKGINKEDLGKALVKVRRKRNNSKKNKKETAAKSG